MLQSERPMTTADMDLPTLEKKLTADQDKALKPGGSHIYMRTGSLTSRRPGRKQKPDAATFINSWGLPWRIHLSVSMLGQGCFDKVAS